MLPPTHVTFAYVVSRFLVKKTLTGKRVWLLALFSMLPDLVDKSLHYGFGLFRSGRTTLHNVFLVISLALIYLMLTDRRSRIYTLLILIGLGSHLVGDVVQTSITALYRDFSEAKDWYLFVLFPVFDVGQPGIRFDIVDVFWESMFTGLVLTRWYRDGMPGLGSVARHV